MANPSASIRWDFVLVSLSLLYTLYRVVWPSDPIRSFELPPRLQAIFTLWDLVPLGLPLLVVLASVQSVIGPYLIFVALRRGVRLGQLIEYGYFLFGGPVCALTLAILLAFLADVTRPAWTIGMAVLILASLPYLFWWQVSALSASTAQSAKTCTAVIVAFFLLSMFMPPVHRLVLGSFHVGSGAMEPTLRAGDRLLANKIVYSFRRPRRGEVVVFHNPTEADPDRISLFRIVGLPGDTIEVRDGALLLNSELVSRRVEHGDATQAHIFTEQLPGAKAYRVLLRDGEHHFAPRDILGPVTVENDRYFVMGDNRDNAYDSRFWGTVPRDLLVGHVYFRLWPLDRAGLDAQSFDGAS